jgi:hypothetical protein
MPARWLCDRHPRERAAFTFGASDWATGGASSPVRAKRTTETSDSMTYCSSTSRASPETFTDADPFIVIFTSATAGAPNGVLIPAESNSSSGNGVGRKSLPILGDQQQLRARPSRCARRSRFEPAVQDPTLGLGILIARSGHVADPLLLCDQTSHNADALTGAKRDRCRTHSATRLPDARVAAPRPATMPTRPGRAGEMSP